MKPCAQTAMRSLIKTVRRSIPLDMSEAELCSGVCRGCSKKLIDFLIMELDDWECRLDQGETPRLGELESFAKSCRKIYKALQRNGLVEA